MSICKKVLELHCESLWLCLQPGHEKALFLTVTASPEPIALDSNVTRASNFCDLTDVTSEVCQKLHSLKCWTISLKRARKTNFKMFWWICYVEVSVENFWSALFIPVWKSFINQYHQHCNLLEHQFQWQLQRLADGSRQSVSLYSLYLWGKPSPSLTLCGKAVC